MPRIAIVGTGLMGASLALALKNSPLLNLEVVGTDSSGGARSGAQKTGAFNRVEGRLLNAVEGADIVVLATPIVAMKELLEVMAPPSAGRLRSYRRGQFQAGGHCLG